LARLARVALFVFHAILFYAVSALTRFFEGPLYQRDLVESNWQIIRWWEKRRFHFNAVLAVVGTITCVLMIACGFISEPLVGEAIGLPDPPILVPLGIIAYAILANICYAGGWIVELLMARSNIAVKKGFGLRAFRVGMKFSICLTVFPAVLSWAVFLWTLFRHRF
jgi:hypothetical protein